MQTVSSAVQTVNIYEAKTQLSKLVDLASSGADVVIARAGKPVARLTALKRKGLDCRGLRRAFAGRSPGAV